MNDLTELLHDAVADVEPADRLAAIRARTGSPASVARPWWWAAGGVVLATAATVTAFAVLGNDPGGSMGHDHGAMSSPPPQETFLVPAYFIGETPHGDRLYREFDQATGDTPVQAALDRIQQPPADPDYSNPWPQGSFVSAKVTISSIDVTVGSAQDDGALRSGDLAVQQVVYTLQGAAGKRLPVHFVEGDLILGATAAPQLDVLSQVMISDPSEGLAVHGSFTATGAASSFEANVPWEIRDQTTGAVVRQGHATATGWGDRLYPWQRRISVAGLPTGSYTFVAMTDDPSAGEGVGPFTDTRTITVR